MNILHGIAQGSAEWLVIRAEYDTASEAPAALGVGKYQSRTELLKQKHTGLSRAIDAGTQALFDRGHAAEAAARPMAEEIIGADLYPVTAALEVDGLKLLASLDGATMDEETIFEHKLWSEPLAEAVRAGALDPHYTVQLDQQLLVTGAKRCLFMTSDGTPEKMTYCWYESSQEKFDALIAGWKQFNADLAAYVPREIADKPQAGAIQALPALSVLIRGEVVSTNLPAFRDAAEAFIANIKTDLETDEDFANAEATVKFCDKAEKDLELAKNAAIAQTASIDELMRTVDFIKDQLREKRLALDKLVTRRKGEIKESIIAEARQKYLAHVKALEDEISLVRLNVPMPDFAGAAKNKRTLASLHDAVDSTLAQAKIDADAMARDLRAKLHWFSGQAVGFTFLFTDLQQIIGKPVDDFQLTVNTRIDQHQAAEEKRLEAERARIAEEERVKAEAAARAELERQQQIARTQAMMEAAQRRREEEEAERATAAAAHAASIVQDVVPRAAEALAEQETIVLAPSLAEAAKNPPPTLRLGQISERLGFSVTADFLRELGVHPAGKERAAVLYHGSDFDRICTAIIARVQVVRDDYRMARAA